MNKEMNFATVHIIKRNMIKEANFALFEVFLLQ